MPVLRLDTCLGGLLQVLPRVQGWFSPAAKRAYGAVAQLGERLVRNEEASGSIPLSSTIRPLFLAFPGNSR